MLDLIKCLGDFLILICLSLNNPGTIYGLDFGA